MADALTSPNIVADMDKARTLLACDRVHGGAAYSRLVIRGEPDFSLQLHLWKACDHLNLGDSVLAVHGYGVLL